MSREELDESKRLLLSKLAQPKQISPQTIIIVLGCTCCIIFSLVLLFGGIALYIVIPKSPYMTPGAIFSTSIAVQPDSRVITLIGKKPYSAHNPSTIAIRIFKYKVFISFQNEPVGFFERDTNLLVLGRKNLDFQLDLSFTKRMDPNITINLTNQLANHQKATLNFQVFAFATYLATNYQFAFQFTDIFSK